jgi:hypothetical protein
MVEFRSSGPKIVLLLGLGPKPPRIITTTGGWQVTARPKEIGLTDWIGREGLKIEFDILIDHFKSQNGAAGELQCRALERLAGLDPSDPDPPAMTVDGGGAIPYDNKVWPRHRWVIDDLAEDPDFIERNDRGQRVRTRYDVTIAQYVRDSKLARLPAAHRRKKRKKKEQQLIKVDPRNPKKIHVIKGSETLEELAKRVYGSASHWTEIAEINGIRDPRSVRPGMVIKLP